MKQQFYFFLGALLALPLFPALFYIGKKVRKNVPQLGEATENLTFTIKGNDEVIRLLCVGESTIAGVGVTDHREGITGQIAKTTHELTGKTVHWTVLAKSGYTAQDTLEQLAPQLPNPHFDLIIIGLGGNDTFQLNSPLTFRKYFIKLVAAIKAKQPQATIVIANMPPIGEFPAFPPLLQFFLGNLVKLHGAVISDIPLLFPKVKYLNEEIHFDEWIGKAGENATITTFFSDGVHPSALTYAIWGRQIGAFALQ